MVRPSVELSIRGQLLGIYDVSFGGVNFGASADDYVAEAIDSAIEDGVVGPKQKKLITGRLLFIELSEP